MNTARVIKFPTNKSKDASFVLLSRSLKTCSFKRNPERVALWVHLVLDANYTSKVVTFNGALVNRKRGQVVTSRKQLAFDCGLTESCVKAALKAFESEDRIRVETKKGVNGFTIITLLKYDVYQPVFDPKNDENNDQTNDQLNDQTNDQPEPAPHKALEGDSDQTNNQLNDQTNDQRQYKEILNKPTLTLPAEGKFLDDGSLREFLADLLEKRFENECTDTKLFHDAIESLILSEGLSCRREFPVDDRGDGSTGRLALLVTDENGRKCGIELGYQGAKNKSIAKLQDVCGMVVLRKAKFSRMTKDGVLIIAGNKHEEPTPTKESIDFMPFAQAYNDILGDRLPQWDGKPLGADRIKSFQALLPKLAEPTVECFSSYLHAFSSRARSFYFGDSKGGWRASLDYLLRVSTLTATREGSIGQFNTEEDDE